MINARFWEWINDDWVKITLKPGQVLEWSQGYPTEEGWHRESRLWSHEGKQIRYYGQTDGVDCDGRLTNNYEFVAKINELDTRVRGDYTLPKWTEVASSQYDQFAQMAGY